MKVKAAQIPMPHEIPRAIWAVKITDWITKMRRASLMGSNSPADVIDEDVLMGDQFRLEPLKRRQGAWMLRNDIWLPRDRMLTSGQAGPSGGDFTGFGYPVALENLPTFCGQPDVIRFEVRDLLKLAFYGAGGFDVVAARGGVDLVVPGHSDSTSRASFAKGWRALMTAWAESRSMNTMSDLPPVPVMLHSGEGHAWEI
jgi:hypothetical protein